MNENIPDEQEIFQTEIIVPASSVQLEEVSIVPQAPKRRLRLPLLLFIATCLSTLMTGMATASYRATWGEAFWHGLKYAGPLMTILVCHEMGHFLQAWRHGVYASLPYFIPMPASPIGTMGAVIAMQARMGDRRSLFDIGISGPLAGLAPTLICCVLGIYWSTPILGRGELGDPLLFKILTYAMGKHIPTGFDLLLHPVAYAGWVGLLITSLNLFPIGLLDGGHILYALLGRKAHTVARLLLVAAIVAIIYFQLYMWMLMIFLLIMIGPSHPPTANDYESLGWWRIILGWLTLAFIPLGFVPVPFNIGP